MSTIADHYEAFTKLAKAYCAAVEDPSVKGLAGLRALYNLLSQLQVAAMELPTVQSDTDFVRDRDIEHEEYKAICSDLQQRLPIDI